MIGAGHAGIEAALVAAKLRCKTSVFTINMDAVGNCPCNPSIGGTAKGQLVFEIDALGGEMAKTADACCLQSRMLNRGKGPAVQSLRMQIDRRKYGEIMKHKLELQPGVDLKQAEVVGMEKALNENFNYLVKTRTGAVFFAKTVILATGTYLDSKIFIGETSFSSGPDGIFPATFLGGSLKKLKLQTRRFKTGTPARVIKSSIDFSKMDVQFGDENIIPFSRETDPAQIKNLEICHISWTNQDTKKVILDNINRSPLYSGQIEGIGPRYCPSIEDKIARFPERERHQLFVEPCGINTEEMYLQGMSSSLPEDVQLQLYRTIPGLEDVKITRPAYAIEYDCIDPLQLNSSLEFIDHPGLFCAGQLSGSSGYEEAAAQGLIAGINAARKVLGRERIVLDRASSYIGTLIDDLTAKGVSDPYRMLTSRSEYRLILRQNNAEERLTPLGYELGLISDSRWHNFQMKRNKKMEEIERIKKVTISPIKIVNNILTLHGTSEIISGTNLIDLLRRPQLNYEILSPIDITRPEISPEILEQVETEVKYEGYIRRQLAQIQEMRRLEAKELPNDIDYNKIQGLRLEAMEKLAKTRPDNIGQASRISGVTPADISILLIWLNKNHSHNIDWSR